MSKLVTHVTLKENRSVIKTKHVYIYTLWRYQYTKILNNINTSAISLKSVDFWYWKIIAGFIVRGNGAYSIWGAF